MCPDARRQASGRAGDRSTDDVEEHFAGRCLVLDGECASHYAHIIANRSRMGRSISVEDAQIAAIALARGMRLATRNTADFAHIDGLPLIDPWIAI